MQFAASSMRNLAREITSVSCIQGCRNALPVEIRCLGLSVSSLRIRSLAEKQRERKASVAQQAYRHHTEVYEKRI